MIVSAIRQLSSFHNARRFYIATARAVTALAACTCGAAHAGEVAHPNTSYAPPPAQLMSGLPPVPSARSRPAPTALVHFDVSFPKAASGSPLQTLYGSSALAFEHAIHAGTSRLVTSPASSHAAPVVTEDLVLTYAGQSRDRISLHLAYEQLTAIEAPGQSVPRTAPITTEIRFDTDVTLPICPADHHCIDKLVTLGDSGALLRLGAAPYDAPVPQIPDVTAAGHDAE